MCVRDLYVSAVLCKLHFFSLCCWYKNYRMLIYILWEYVAYHMYSMQAVEQH